MVDSQLTMEELQSLPEGTVIKVYGGAISFDSTFYARKNGTGMWVHYKQRHSYASDLLYDYYVARRVCDLEQWLYE